MLGIEQIRKSRGLSMQELASRLGVSVPTVWAWEVGKKSPMTDRLPAIAKALDCTVGELFGETKEG